MEKFYRITEIAKMLKVSPLTVRRWVLEGKLKAFHPSGTRLYRIPESSLKAFIGEEWWHTLIASFPERPERRKRKRG